MKENEAPKITDKTVTAVSVSATSVIIRWNKATDVETDPDKLLYTVTWCEAPYTWDKRRKIDKRVYYNSSYVISGLAPNTTYDIYVYASDGHGYEAGYNKLTVKTSAVQQAVNRNATPAPGVIQTITNEERRKKINEGLRGLKFDPKKVLVTSYDDYEKEGEKYIIRNGKCYMLKTKKHSKSFSDPDIICRPDSNIYPGAFLLGNKRMLDGNPKSPVFERGEVTVIMDFMGGYRTSRTTIATESQIYRVIQEMIKEFWSSGQKGGGSIAGVETGYSSISKMAIDLNCDMDFLGVEAKVNFNVSAENKKIISVVDYSQIFYTVTIESKFMNRADYFGRNVTWEELQTEGVNDNNPLVLVNKVSYGRRMYLFKEYSYDNFTFRGSQKVSGYSQSLTSTQDIINTTEATKKWVYIQGGGAKFAVNVYTDSENPQKVKELLNAYPEFTPQNPGMPIAYSSIFVTDNSHAYLHVEGNYSSTEYMLYPSICDIRVKSDAWGTGPTLNHMKVRFDYNTFYVRNGQKIPGRKMEAAPEWKLEQKTDKKDVLPLQPNEYIDGDVRVQVRRKWCGNWANQFVEFVSPATGYIRVNISGHFKNLKANIQTER